MAVASSGVVLEELECVRKTLKNGETLTVESCQKELVQLKIRHSSHKEVTLKLQFPADYPDSILLIEVTSKYISDTLLQKLVKICEQELRPIGKPQQVLRAFSFVNEFILNNPFVVCSDEVAYIKESLHRDEDCLKIKSKTGVITYKAFQEKYFLEFKVSVPFNYPSEHVKLDLKQSNLPPNLFSVIKGQSEELLRQCVQEPIRKKKNDPPFQPKPSLKSLFDFLVCDCVRRYPLEVCHMCHETALPADPKSVVSVEGNPLYVYRMYCGHLYHHSCLDVYTKTPPFAGGKKCLSCGQRLSHDKWNVPPKIAEDRWAHQEAKRREIAEVAEFLGLD